MVIRFGTFFFCFMIRLKRQVHVAGMYTMVWMNQGVHRDAATPWCVFKLILVCMKVLFDKKAWECLHD